MSKPYWNNWHSNFETKNKKTTHIIESKTFREICMSTTKKFFFELDNQSDVNEIADCIRNMNRQTKQNLFVFNKTKRVYKENHKNDQFL